MQPLRPMRVGAVPQRVWCRLALCWALALMFAVPQLFIFVETEERRPSDGRVVRHCKSAGYTAEWQRKVSLTSSVGLVSRFCKKVTKYNFT